MALCLRALKMCMAKFTDPSERGKKKEKREEIHKDGK